MQLFKNIIIIIISIIVLLPIRATELTFPSIITLNTTIQNINNITINNSALNLTNLNTLQINNTDLNLLPFWIKVGDFDLRNISNYSQFTKSADFNLGNISNDTLRITGNASIASWNATSTALFPREFNLKVGIGTTNPLTALHVNGSFPSVGGVRTGLILTEATYNFTSILLQPNNTRAAFTVSNGDIIFYNTITNNALVAGDEKLRITSGGNVGIGTTAPRGILHTSASGYDAGNDIGSVIFTGTGAIGSMLTLEAQGGSGQNWSIFSSGSGAAAGAGKFVIWDNVNNVNRLVIDNTGKVGINTTAPAQTLTVQGTANITASGGTGDLFVDSNGRVGIGTTSPTGLLQVGAGASSTTPNKIGGATNIREVISGVTQNETIGLQLQVNDGTRNGRVEFFMADNTSNNGAWGLWQTYSSGGAQPFVIGNNDAEKFRIDSSGNVGINTTNPAQTLTVQGTLNVTSQPTRSGDLFVASSGNVGIGTTTPSYLLHVQGAALLGNSSTGNIIASADGALEIFRTSIPYIDFKNAFTDDRDVRLMQLGDNSLSVQGSDGVTDLFINTSSNNVGIGTTAPVEKFGLTGTGFVSLGLERRTDTTTVSPLLVFDTSTTNGVWTVQNSAGNLLFYIGGTLGTAVGTEKIRFDTNGNVGIGTTSPSSPLTVSSSSNTVFGATIVNSGGSGRGLNITTGSSGSSIAIPLSIEDNTGNNVLEVLADGTLLLDANQFIYNGTNNRVGIGTTTPNDALEVIGNVRVSGTINASSINTTGNAYFVGKVGINTTAPGQTLTVIGTLNVTPLNQTDRGIPAIFVDSTGKVGINTSNLTATLNVKGGVKIQSVSLTNNSGSYPILNMSNATGQTTCFFNIHGSLSCKGTKSAIQPTDNYGERLLYAVESPEVRYADFGRGITNKGFANISIEPIFRETIEDYDVQLTAYGRFKNFYVSEKAYNYFIVIDDGGNDFKFSYMIYGLRKGYIETRFSVNPFLNIEKITALIDTATSTTTATIKFNDKDNQIISIASTDINTIITTIAQTLNASEDEIKNAIIFKYK